MALLSHEGGGGYYASPHAIHPTLEHSHHYALTLKHEMNLVKSLLTSASLPIGHSPTDGASNVVRLINQQHSHPKSPFDTVNFPLPTDFLRSTNIGGAAAIIGDSGGHLDH